MDGQKRLLRRLSLRGVESDKPRVCMRRIKSQFLHAVEGKIWSVARKTSKTASSQKTQGCGTRWRAALGRLFCANNIFVGQRCPTLMPVLSHGFAHYFPISRTVHLRF